MTHVKYAAWLLCGAVFATSAQATTSNVVGPDVTAGKTKIAARFGFDHDDDHSDAYNQRFHIDYGIDDTWGIRLITKQQRKQSYNLEYKATDFELKHQFFEDEIDGFDGSVKVVYSLSDGDKKPDKAALYWAYKYSNDRWNLCYNTALSHQIGEDATDGIGLEFRWQAMAKILRNHSLGLEMFNDLGKLNHQHGYDQQNHRIGPVVKGKLGHGLSYQSGMLIGISDDAPDLGFKLFLTQSF